MRVTQKRYLQIIFIIIFVSFIFFNIIFFYSYKNKKKIIQENIILEDETIFIEKNKNILIQPQINKNSLYEIVFDEELNISYPEFICPVGKWWNSWKHKYFVYHTLLKEWKEFSKKYNITYIIFYGSLLSYYREKNIMIPWDGDIDILCYENDIETLNSLDSWDINENFHISIHKNFRTNSLGRSLRTWCKKNNKLYDCRYDLPSGRFFYQPNHLKEERKCKKDGICFYIDIYPMKVSEDGLYVIPESKRNPKKKLFSNILYNDVFPIQKSNFMGVDNLLFPNKPKEILKKVYFNLEPPYACDPNKKKWYILNENSIKEKKYVNF